MQEISQQNSQPAANSNKKLLLKLKIIFWIQFVYFSFSLILPICLYFYSLTFSENEMFVDESGRSIFQFLAIFIFNLLVTIGNFYFSLLFFIYQARNSWSLFIIIYNSVFIFSLFIILINNENFFDNYFQLFYLIINPILFIASFTLQLVYLKRKIRKLKNRLLKS